MAAGGRERPPPGAAASLRLSAARPRECKGAWEKPGRSYETGFHLPERSVPGMQPGLRERELGVRETRARVA